MNEAGIAEAIAWIRTAAPRDTLKDADERDWISLGHAHAYVPLLDDDGTLRSIVQAHLTPEGEWCSGAIPFERPNWPADRTWKLENTEPLTVSPSLLCTICGNHGFIRDGQWVPA